ncbi:MAG: HAD family hydrolase [Candidatus Kapaibacterium sp.]
MNYLIWDFDGTLGYRAGMWSGTLLEILDGEMPGHGRTIDDIRPHLRSGFPWHNHHITNPPNRSPDEWWLALHDLFRNAFIALGVPPPDAPRLAALVRPAYLDLNRWRLYDDTIPTLDALSALGWRHILLSNHVPELPEILQYLGLRRRFLSIFNSAVTGHEKPHPSAFRAVLDTIRPGATIWMIGDSMAADIRGAEAVGIPAIPVRGEEKGGIIAIVEGSRG